jgi:hypothetical protein
MTVSTPGIWLLTPLRKPTPNKKIIGPAGPGASIGSRRTGKPAVTSRPRLLPSRVNDHDQHRQIRHDNRPRRRQFRNHDHCPNRKPDYNHRHPDGYRPGFGHRGCLLVAAESFDPVGDSGRNIVLVLRHLLCADPTAGRSEVRPGRRSKPPRPPARLARPFHSCWRH